MAGSEVTERTVALAAATDVIELLGEDSELAPGFEDALHERIAALIEARAALLLRPQQPSAPAPLPKPVSCEAERCTRRLQHARRVTYDGPGGAVEVAENTSPVDISTPVYEVRRATIDGHMVTVCKKLESAPGVAYGVLHFGTCTDPARFRRGGR